MRNYFVFFLFFLLAACSQTSSNSIGLGEGSADHILLKKKLKAAATAFDLVASREYARIPSEVLKAARCAVVFPGVLKAAFFAGANYGHGVASCRVEDKWSRPSFISLTGGSLGLQIGAEEIDLVLLFMESSAVESLLNDSVTMGVDVGISAGPDGEKLHEKTNSSLHGILAYSQAWGVFAGFSLEGSVLRPDANSNQVYYGRGMKAAELLTTPQAEGKESQEANFCAALKNVD